MANFSTLKADIQSVIRQNGQGAITGALLQSTLLAMVNSLGMGYKYMGIATTATVPGTPDQNLFYIAEEVGTYPNFGNIEVAAGELAFLKYGGSWQKDSIALATSAQVDAVIQQVSRNTSDIADLTAQFQGLQPIVINGNVTNAPDEVDITSNASNLLQLKNRTAAVGRKGYVILRTGSTFASQSTAQNTIYEVRYAFDLSGADVTLPSGCVLKFKGGRLSNGVLSCGDNTEIYNGNFYNCPLVALGNFKITDSISVIDNNVASLSRHGNILAEGGGNDAAYVEITNCRLEHTYTTLSVYGCNIKLIGDNHDITFNVTGNYTYNLTQIGIETQGATHFVSGICANNTVIMSGTTGEGIGISVVAKNSNVIVANNYVESRILGIEYNDNVTIIGNTVKMATATYPAIQTSTQDVTDGIGRVLYNKVLCGRVCIQDASNVNEIIGNEIHGTLLLDGRTHNINTFIVKDNFIMQDANDLTYHALMIYRNKSASRGFVENNIIIEQYAGNDYNFTALNNCIMRYNKFYFMENRMLPIVFISPNDVDFSDNFIYVSQSSDFYGLAHTMIDIESASGNTDSIVLKRNIYQFGNLSTILAGSVQIRPYIEVGTYQAANVYEEETIVRDYNERKIGTTAQRPNIPLYGGVSKYFDTTLKKPLWWVNPDWCDATGTAVV